MEDTTEQLLWEDEADDNEYEEEQQDQADDQPAQQQQQDATLAQGEMVTKEAEQSAAATKPPRTRTAIVFPDIRPTSTAEDVNKPQQQQQQQKSGGPAPVRQAVASKVSVEACFAAVHLQSAMRSPVLLPKHHLDLTRSSLTLPLQELQQRPGTGKKISYFVIRSNNHENVDISVRMGGWATPRHNEIKLDEAYRNSDEVGVEGKGKHALHQYCAVHGGAQLITLCWTT
jgi:hypothetical protein